MFPLSGNPPPPMTVPCLHEATESVTVIGSFMHLDPSSSMLMLSACSHNRCWPALSLRTTSFSFFNLNFFHPQQIVLPLLVKQKTRGLLKQRMPRELSVKDLKCISVLETAPRQPVVSTQADPTAPATSPLRKVSVLSILIMRGEHAGCSAPFQESAV